MHHFCLGSRLRPITLSTLHLNWKLETKRGGALPVPEFSKGSLEHELLPYRWPLSQGLSQCNTMTIYP